MIGEALVIIKFNELYNNFILIYLINRCPTTDKYSQYLTFTKIIKLILETR